MRIDYDPQDLEIIKKFHEMYGTKAYVFRSELDKQLEPRKDIPKENEIIKRNDLFQATKKTIYFRHPYQTAIELLLTKPSFKISANDKKWESVVKSNEDDEVDFSGGTYEEALAVGNVDFFNGFRERLEQSQMHRQIVPDFLLNRKRRRVKSEVDGDYNYDERWSLFPYSTAKKQYLPLPALRLVADFGIHCGYKSDQINAFGAVMWSLSQILESIGITTEVVIRAKTRSLHYEDKKANDFILTLIVKHRGEYLSPIAMTTCFRSVFFRRAMFNLDIMAADFMGAEVASGLGHPEKYVNLVGFKDGELIMEIDIIDHLDKLKSKIEEIFTKGISNVL